MSISRGRKSRESCVSPLIEYPLIDTPQTQLTNHYMMSELHALYTSPSPAIEIPLQATMTTGLSVRTGVSAQLLI